MKKFSLFSNSLLALMALVMITLTSCGDDPLTPQAIPPSLRFEDDGAGSLIADATVDAGATYTINVIASVGDNPLKVLTLDEDGTNIDKDRLGHVSLSSANPALLFDTDKNELNWVITITAPTIPGTYSLTATVEDDAGETDSESINITIADEPPTISLAITDPAVVDAGTLVAIKTTAAAGARRLNTLTIWEDGVEITDLTRIRFQGVEFTANPLTLDEGDKDGFTDAEILIRAVAAGDETHTYTIIVEDEGASAASVEKDIKTNPVGTPINNTLTGILLNAGGPPNTGGVDLLTGNKDLGSNAAAAHLHDEGIDTNLAADINWKKRISGQSNGSVVKLIDTTLLPEGFSFETVTTLEQIQGADDNGIAFTNTNIDGELISWEVEVGDIYTVQNGTNLFLIEIAEVNNKPAVGDNSDNYVINIKH